MSALGLTSIPSPAHPPTKEDGCHTFSIRVVVNFELYSVLMSYGPGLQVLGPRFVVHHMADMLRQAADLYACPIRETGRLQDEDAEEGGRHPAVQGRNSDAEEG